MIAGPSASAQAAAALGQGQGQNQGMGQGMGQTPSKAGATSAASKGGGSSKGGAATKNPGPRDNPLEELPMGTPTDSRTASANGDTAAKPATFQAPPWFAKLPKRQQDAIRAEALRRAPRGYEERLKRYFESVE